MNPQEHLPDQLIRHLRQERQTTLLVPRELDRAILDEAERHFARRRPRRNPAWRYLPMAATLLVAVLVLRQFAFGPAPDAESTADVDGSGQVDVLDAFALARRQAAGDTTVTDASIDELLARIVSLSPEAGS